jgi:glucose/arabinose dehydrogenase
MRLRTWIAGLAAVAALGASIALVWPGDGESAVAVSLTPVASDLGDALDVVSPPNDPRQFIVQQSGKILILEDGRVLPRPFLNVSGKIVSGGEQGLLGLAFHPDYARNGRFFIDYTNRSGDTRVVEYRVSSKPDRANPGSARTLLAIDQPFANHNGGDLVFGPDGMLYVGMGDGGSGGDPFRNGQNPRSLLGKLLRIDVDGRSGGKPYRIPAGNPYAKNGRGAPEVYAIGLRNPWRFSFDRRTGDLWIADVGQNEYEEVDFRRAGTGAGANFGWNRFEGNHQFSDTPLTGGRSVKPVAEYSHSFGNSVTGGYVYRGSVVPALRGRYVYADYGSGRVWSMRAGPRPGPASEITGSLGVQLSGVTSFGEDAKGELYVIANSTLYRFSRP